MKHTVLVVEDDKSVVYMLEMALRNAGFEVRLAADGIAGWDSFQADPPDIVLCDIKMPGMDGIELLAQIKAADPTMDVVLLTGYADLPTAIQAVKHGAYRYLEKPISHIGNLIQTLQEALEKRQLLRDRELIDRISFDLSGRLSLSDFMDRFLDHVLETFPQVHAAFISLYDPERDRLIFERMQGLPIGRDLAGQVLESEWSIGAKAFSQATPIRCDFGHMNEQEIDRYLALGVPGALKELIRQYPELGVVGIPIISRDVPIGSLAIASCDSLVTIDEHLIGLLDTLCRQVGLYLENAELVAGLRAQTGRMEAVLDSTVDGMIVIDPAGKVLMTNDRYRALFAPDGELDQDRQDELIATLRVCLELQVQTQFVFELEREAAGEPILLETIAAHVYQDAESIGIVASLRDVTFLRSLERKRGEILRFAKHQVGSPLAAIGVCAGQLLDDRLEFSEQQRKEILRQIIHQVHEVDEVVEKTLGYSHLKEALLTGKQVMFDFSQVALALALEAARLAEKEGIQFLYQIDPGLFMVGNQFAFKQALRNLLDNARKFNHQDGVIRWTACRDGNKIRISVQDTGRGIPDGDLECIFVPYHRGQNVRDLAGTGLGLSVVQDVIRAHSGKISVQSQENEGARFTITVPAVALK